LISSSSLKRLKKSIDSLESSWQYPAMKILIEIEGDDETGLIALADADMRSKTAMAKKLLVEGIRREVEAIKSKPSEVAP
jgi:hypothetical protein